MTPPFCLQHGSVYAVPVLHLTMESAAEVYRIFHQVQPDVVAVELPQEFAEEFRHAAHRLPEVSLLSVDEGRRHFLLEPTDPMMEGMRCALEAGVEIRCIDRDVADYPRFRDQLPDPYAITHIGARRYFEAYTRSGGGAITQADHQREHQMAHRLKELTLSYDRVLFITGMHHAMRVLEQIDDDQFEDLPASEQADARLSALSEQAEREVAAESGWTRYLYEVARKGCQSVPHELVPDRHKILFYLFQCAGTSYVKKTGFPFPGYHLRNLMKYARNYAMTTGGLLPDLFQTVEAARGCVDDNYAQIVWELATHSSERRNIDNLPETSPSVEELWGNSRKIRFRLKQKREKGGTSQAKGSQSYRFDPPAPWCLCSYPPEDLRIERFGEYLRSKGVALTTEETARTLPFTASMEDGLDVRETMRNWHRDQLYVKIAGRPPGPTGAVVVIFNADQTAEEGYPWKVTWLGEHAQESDMAFYATERMREVVGPGICRCEYGGFMLSFPPRRLLDVWTDPDYGACQTKAEVLLMAAIDYAVDPVVIYVAATPPRNYFKGYAAQYGKRLVYFPIGQLSPVELNQLRRFHVLDHHQRRESAGDFIL